MTLNGYVSHIVFRNEDNGYTVLELNEKGKEHTVYGIFPRLSEGEYLEVTGRPVEHPLYGAQLEMESYSWKNPEDAGAIERYLASGAVKGIGESLAARIVKRFGDDTFRIIEEEPERLAEVKGISMRGAMQIASQVAEKQDLRQAMLFLQGYGISMNLAGKIYERYGREVYEVIRTNPYRLADDIDGVGFLTADEIAKQVGIGPDSEFRLESGVRYALGQAMGMGHLYLPKEELAARTGELLNIDATEIDRVLMNLLMEKKIVIRMSGEEKKVYLPRYYYMEMNVARMLCGLSRSFPVSKTNVEKRIARIEREEKILLDELQRDAVMKAAGNGLLVLTGGPGTGKTTTIRTIIRFFEEEGMDILLAAPTGRAAKRMTETTGREAKTIHRMLEPSGGVGEPGEARFERNDDNPLECDAIIIDEMSMVDLPLMNALLKAIVPGTRLVLVGDVNQLPSVGPGNVLRDIIDSECFSVVRLNRIFRQAATSDIIVNAHRINRGESVETGPGSRDFIFVHRKDVASVQNTVIGLVMNKLPGYVQAEAREIQVMTPMRKGPLGVENLNRLMQQFLNPPAAGKREHEFAHATFREGDKVMQIKNNYDLSWEIVNRAGIPLETGSGIFNGDIGIIREINEFAEEMTVEFDDGHRIHYDFKLAEELELAYAITIHKSQGSEYPAAVIPIFAGPRMLMSRNLLYTAVTRARKCVCIVGLEEAFFAMIDNTTEQKRYSSLREQICDMAAIERTRG